MNPWIKSLIGLTRAGAVDDVDARARADLAARALVGYLGACLERGEPPPSELAAYFAQAFKQIADGHSADDALNTSGDSSKYRRDCEIARAVWKAHAGDRLPLRDSGKGAGAYSLVAEQFGMSADNVERIYKKMRWLVDVEATDTRNVTLDPGEERVGPELPKELKQRTLVDAHIVFAKLTEQLKKQGRK